MEHNFDCEPCQKCYSYRKCRCEKCTIAHKIYEQRRIKARSEPDWDNPRVNPRRAQNHLIYLASKGVGMKEVHRKTGVAISTLTFIKNGRKQYIFKNIETKIISVALGECRINSRSKIWNKKMRLPRPVRWDEGAGEPEPDIDNKTIKRLESFLCKGYIEE